MNTDIVRLLDKAERSLSAARLLLNQEHHNFAISRAYYAMFYVAESLLASLGKAYSSHAAGIAAFGREFAKTGKLDSKFHRWLIDARTCVTSATTELIGE
ncbi:MAG: HEPN domain-containing protein [Candidatus Bipolaricaulota bacterium]|nr:HEPN domain-containing protein [Candidatus Bipolaricaulota bacterium]